jgi:hypothetical protein
MPFVVKVYLTVSFGCGYAALSLSWLRKGFPSRLANYRVSPANAGCLRARNGFMILLKGVQIVQNGDGQLKMKNIVVHKTLKRAQKQMHHQFVQIAGRL